MTWDRIRGHDNLRKQFQSAYERGRFGQAFLFVGPEGVGKHFFATELAKALLCERAPAPLTACDHCPACAQVEVGTHPDVFRVGTPEGKQEFPIDVMREFCERMARKPTRGARKVGIVEDADDFNEESANAFLKTLEEPPPGTLLILLGSTPDRQRATILSRCQLVRFAPLKFDVIRAILKEHGVHDPTQLDRIARLSAGSAGQALALNDPDIWAFREKLLDGLSDTRPNFAMLAEYWFKYSEAAGKESAAQRTRLSLALRFVVEWLRAALRLSLEANVGELASGDEARLRNFAERLGPDGLLELADNCVEADRNVERRVQLILVIESVVNAFWKIRPVPG